MRMGMASPETELWALCTGCDRWFSSSLGTETAAAPGCPVCARGPAVVEERSSDPRVEADVVFSEIWLG